jgi:hypothetical protein
MGSSSMSNRGRAISALPVASMVTLALTFPCRYEIIHYKVYVFAVLKAAKTPELWGFFIALRNHSHRLRVTSKARERGWLQVALPLEGAT